ncbi:alpha-glucosidase [Auricularia subglabra TFB-10046 SS5]|nr:alpha-glucosidase [Auricularia subglabra TFB-10046 SS5]
MLVLTFFTSLLLAAPSALGLKEHDFKTCSQAGFCRRGRALAERATRAGATWQSPYSLDPNTIEIAQDQAALSAKVKTSLYPDVTFTLEARIHDDGVARVRMDEYRGWRKRYDGTADWTLIKEPVVSNSVQWNKGKRDVSATYGDVQLRIEYKPLRVVMLRGGKEEVVINGRGLLHMEHFRKERGGDQATSSSSSAAADPTPDDNIQVVLDGDKPSEPAAPVETPKKVNPNAWFEGDDEDGYWEEQFNSWRDSKPKGPESFSLDINFPRHSHLYGIPQRATRLALPSTTGTDPFFTEPYRLYNLDVFEYLASSAFGLYGSIPLLHAHSADSTVAVLNLVASETWVDLYYPTPKSSSTHWISESGILDLLLLPGPTPEHVFEQYAALTGATAMPAAWALGYHQCRWNYVSSDDVRSVQTRFDEDDMPVDVFWLDIEYAPDHKYMIWDEKGFPDPVQMLTDVEKNERHMVVIVDPHLKRVSDYPVYKRASELGLMVKTASGDNEYEGWCWPGNSAWMDFFNPAAWDFWKTVFKVDDKDVPKGEWHWSQSSVKLGIWNDMNEPSVFNGPEITMQKDLIHHGGWEHRDIHNLNGVLYHNATSVAVRGRTNPEMRPFVLSRAFFAGSQRFGAIWTGDNMGTWEHMAVGIPMVLSNGIAGMTFAGADVGGFFGNPDPEMLTRWYQVGAFAPFFRAHAHIDTKRREPYLLDEPYKSIVRNVLRLRYSLLPVWYTAFHTASTRGIPILRPQYVMYPKDAEGFSIDDQYYIGNSGLLVHPVTTPNTNEAKVYLSAAQPYYDYFTHAILRGGKKHVTVPAELHQLPLFIRGGSIVPTRERPRRASPLMKRDPFTLTVALDRDGKAQGELYLDDGESYAFQQGALVWRAFEFANGKLSSRDLVKAHPSQAVDGVQLATYDPATNAYAQSIKDVRVEKVVVLGLKSKPKSVKTSSRATLEFQWTDGVAASASQEGSASKLIIKDPKARIVEDWSIAFE